MKFCSNSFHSSFIRCKCVFQHFNSFEIPIVSPFILSIGIDHFFIRPKYSEFYCYCLTVIHYITFRFSNHSNFHFSQSSSAYYKWVSGWRPLHWLCCFCCWWLSEHFIHNTKFLSSQKGKQIWNYLALNESNFRVNKFNEKCCSLSLDWVIMIWLGVTKRKYISILQVYKKYIDSCVTKQNKTKTSLNAKIPNATKNFRKIVDGNVFVCFLLVHSIVIVPYCKFVKFEPIDLYFFLDARQRNANKPHLFFPI